jgi:hypothetical protein
VPARYTVSSYCAIARTPAVLLTPTRVKSPVVLALGAAAAVPGTRRPTRSASDATALVLIRVDREICINSVNTSDNSVRSTPARVASLTAGDNRPAL